MANSSIDVLLNFTANTSNAVQGANDVNSSVTKVGKSIGGAATAIIAFGAALFKLTRESFVDFNAQMANVNSVVLETKQGLTDMTEEVIQLTNSGLRSYASETAKALYNVASAGIEVSKRMETTDIILKTCQLR